MNNQNKYNIVEHVEGDYYNRTGNFQNIEYLQIKNQKTNNAISKYYHSKEMIKYYEKHHSLAGYAGKHIASMLAFDLDCKNDWSFDEGIKIVLSDAVLLVEFFLFHCAISEDQIYIYDSGNKGLHIEIPLLFGMSEIIPSNDFYNFEKNIVMGIDSKLNLASVDYNLYKINGLYRVENTLNPKSGFYKTRISVTELYQSYNLGKINHFQNPRKFTYSFETEIKISPTLSEFVKKAQSKISDEKIEIKQIPKYSDKLYNKSQMLPACKSIAGKVDNYQDYITILVSLASIGEDGRELMHIALKNDNYPEDTVEKLDSEFTRILNWYNTSRKSKITIGSLFYIAEKYGYKNKINFSLSDVGNAELFIHLYGNKFCYIVEYKNFFEWDGMIWKEDVHCEIYNKAKRLSDKINTKLLKKSKNIDVKELIKHKNRTLSNTGIENFLNLVKRDKRMIKSGLEFDNNPNFFNCQNGTIILNSDGTYYLKEHDRKDYLTQISKVKYESNAVSPMWLEFMDLIFDGDKELILFVQKALGYSITGNTDEDTLFFLFGSGANGKSTFLQVLISLLGNYHRRAKIDMLIRNKGESTGMDVVRLKGARFVSSSETNIGTSFDEAKIKDLTGGDTISGRKLYQDIIEFIPQFKLWIFGNHKPRIKGNDHGIRRRIKIIPFTVQIPKEQQISRSKLLKQFEAEASGIFNWILEGYFLYKKEGLKVPDSIINITDDYFDSSDIVGNFLEEYVEFNVNSECKVQTLFERFKLYTQEISERTWTRSSFNSEMMNRGFKKRKIGSRGYFWLGLEIKKWSSEYEESTTPTPPNYLPNMIPPPAFSSNNLDDSPSFPAN